TKRFDAKPTPLQPATAWPEHRPLIGARPRVVHGPAGPSVFAGRRTFLRPAHSGLEAFPTNDRHVPADLLHGRPCHLWTSPGAAGGRSVQRPHCPDPGCSHPVTPLRP